MNTRGPEYAIVRFEDEHLAGEVLMGGLTVWVPTVNQEIRITEDRLRQDVIQLFHDRKNRDLALRLENEMLEHQMLVEVMSS
jgi:hypothetical protein